MKNNEMGSFSNCVQTKMPAIDIDSIARLACLELTEPEKEGFAEDMKSIIAFANKVTELDTSGIKATEHIIPVNNVFHNDEEIIHNVERRELLAATPSQEGGYITVPRVLE